MNIDQFTAYSMMIKHELEAAEAKHPKFCDEMTFTNTDYCGIVEQHIKARNSHAPYCADNILIEEFAEAMHAYQQGNLQHAMQELAQCGAVVLRMMETINKEITK